MAVVVSVAALGRRIVGGVARSIRDATRAGV
jgi:hypothetical protein